LAIVASLAFAAPAFADGEHPIKNQSITGTVPAGGSTTHSSGTIPADATKATITSKPAKGQSPDFFDSLPKVLAAGKTPGKRFLVCITIYAIATDSIPNETLSFKEASRELALLLLGICLTMAAEINQAQPAAHAAATGCPRLSAGVPVAIKRVGGKYQATVKGTPRKAKGALRISCKRSGNGIKIRMRTRSRKQTLRKVIGKKLELGYLNPSGASARVTTTFDVP
jgi:hypothetical protein